MISSGVQVIRVTNPEFFEMIRDTLALEELNGDSYVQQLKAMYAANPELFLILAVVSKTGSIVGYTVTGAPPGFDYTFIWNAWADPKDCPKNVTEDVFNLMIRWTEQKGFTELRCETKREDSMMRAWGFEYFSTNLKFSTKKEVSDGRRQSETDKLVESGSESGVASSGPADSERIG